MRGRAGRPRARGAGLSPPAPWGQELGTLPQGSVEQKLGPERQREEREKIDRDERRQKQKQRGGGLGAEGALSQDP